jgi:UDP-N-acetylmuramate-alanine ligase
MEIKNIHDPKEIQAIVDNALVQGKVFYIMGALGCSMSSIYGYLLQRGAKIKGVDSKSTTAEIASQHKAENIQENTGMVIMSHLFLTKNCEDLEAAKTRGVPIILRLDFLGYIFFHLKSQHEKSMLISIFGTSGKTTTTYFMWSLRKQLGENPSVFCGGYLESVGDNYYLGTGAIVVETDESTPDHMRLHCDNLLFLSMSPDHLENYNNDYDLFKDSCLQQINQSKSVIFYSDGGEMDSLMANSNKTLDVDAFSFSDINPNSNCFLYSFQQSHMGSTGGLLIRKDGKEFNILVAVPFTGIKNMLNYAAVIFSVITEENVKKIVDCSRYIHLAGERHTYCGQINNIQLINNFAQIVTEWYTVINNYKILFPETNIFVVIELVRSERYEREIKKLPTLFPLVKKFFMAPVYSYAQSRYLEWDLLSSVDFPQDKYQSYATMEKVQEALQPIIENETGVIMFFGFNKPLGLQMLQSQIKILKP